MLSLLKCAIAGIIGGAVGAAVWAAIAHFANAEVGWIAWGIGFLVGLCVRIAAGGEAFEGFAPGILAALIAILAVLGGKYAAVSMAVASVDLNQAIKVTDEKMIVVLADEIIKEREAKGQKVQFPAGKTLDTAEAQADYPPAIWKEASQKWAKLGPAGQQQRREEHEANIRQLVGAFRGHIQQQAFAESFSPYDFLWFILAAITAYRIGHGNIASDD